MIYTHSYFMKEALREAQLAFELDEVPIGAVVVWQNKIIGRGHNLVEQLNDPTAHAEMQAITAATNYIGGKYLSDCTLYVSLQPCIMCTGACYWSQIGTLVYGAPDTKRGFGLLSTNILHPKTIVIAGVLESEASELLQSFFKTKR